MYTPNSLKVVLTQTTEPVEWFEDMEAKPSSISCSFFPCLSRLLFGSSSSFASNAEEGRVSLRFIFSSFWPEWGCGQDHHRKPWSLNWPGRSSMSDPITWVLFNNSQTCPLSLEGHVVVGVAPISIYISIWSVYCQCLVSIWSVYGDCGRGCTYQWFIGHFVQLSNIGKANFHRLDVLMSWWFV